MGTVCPKPNVQLKRMAATRRMTGRIGLSFSKQNLRFADRQLSLPACCGTDSWPSEAPFARAPFGLSRWILTGPGPSWHAKYPADGLHPVEFSQRFKRSEP